MSTLPSTGVSGSEDVPSRSAAADIDQPSCGVAGESSGRDVVGASLHILTVNLEDYYHAGTFAQVIDRHNWGRLESRLVPNTLSALELLSDHGARATFFVSCEVATRHRALIREVLDAGHEVAHRGEVPPPVAKYGQYVQQLRNSRDDLEQLIGQRVWGHRRTGGWLGADEMWALEAVSEVGYGYDSSLLPRGLRAADHRTRFIHDRETATGPLREVPLSSLPIFGMSIPFSGGNYMRQFPRFAIERGMRQWWRRYRKPLVLYFHVWELDPQQPRIAAAGMMPRLRQYRNLGRMEDKIARHLESYRFGTIQSHLALPQQPLPPQGTAPRPADPNAPSDLVRESIPLTVTERSRLPVTLVIPCYNEESTLAYLAGHLRDTLTRLESQYEIHLVFVDDHSSDNTLANLREVFGDWPRAQFVSHATNRGVAAAIQTGIASTQNETVCSLDCDCSYDPDELARMIPLLEPDVALVTASPYHPEGHVRNVPAWRLFLSRTLSSLYGQVLPVKLSTYTSCFRVYRRSDVREITLSQSGFLGVAELAAQLALRGAKIVEYPTTLRVRLFGESKMRTFRTILGHLRLLALVASGRMSGLEAKPVERKEDA